MLHRDENLEYLEVGCASRMMPLLVENTRGESTHRPVKSERKNKKESALLPRLAATLLVILIEGDMR